MYGFFKKKRNAVLLDAGDTDPSLGSDISKYLQGYIQSSQGTKCTELEPRLGIRYVWSLTTQLSGFNFCFVLYTNFWPRSMYPVRWVQRIIICEISAIYQIFVDKRYHLISKWNNQFDNSLGNGDCIKRSGMQSGGYRNCPDEKG